MKKLLTILLLSLALQPLSAQSTFEKIKNYVTDNWKFTVTAGTVLAAGGATWWYFNKYKKPATSIATPIINLSAPLPLKIATWNILAQKFYEQYNKSGINMTLAQRASAFAANFSDVLQDRDIILLQEYSAHHENPLHEILQNGGFEIMRASKDDIGTAVAYKKQGDWKPDGRWYTSATFFGLLQKKNMAIRMKNSVNGVSVIVVPVHIPSDRNKLEQIKLLNKIEPQVQSLKNNSNIAGIIVAGDFNYNTYVKYYEPYDVKPNALNYAPLAMVMNGFQNAAHGSPYENAPTAYDNGYTGMDYIFYRPLNNFTMKPISFTIYPNPAEGGLKNLISHDKKKDNGNGLFASDHAKLKADFSIENKK